MQMQISFIESCDRRKQESEVEKSKYIEGLKFIENAKRDEGKNRHVGELE